MPNLVEKQTALRGPEPEDSKTQKVEKPKGGKTIRFSEEVNTRPIPSRNMILGERVGANVTTSLKGPGPNVREGVTAKDFDTLKRRKSQYSPEKAREVAETSYTTGYLGMNKMINGTMHTSIIDESEDSATNIGINPNRNIKEDYYNKEMGKVMPLEYNLTPSKINDDHFSSLPERNRPQRNRSSAMNATNVDPLATNFDFEVGNKYETIKGMQIKINSMGKQYEQGTSILIPVNVTLTHAGKSMDPEDLTIIYDPQSKRKFLYDQESDENDPASETSFEIFDKVSGGGRRRKQTRRQKKNQKAKNKKSRRTARK